jgi:molybdenum transport protein
VSPSCPYILSDAELDRFYAEDVPFGDLTSRTLGLGHQPGRMLFQARAAIATC